MAPNLLDVLANRLIQIRDRLVVKKTARLDGSSGMSDSSSDVGLRAALGAALRVLYRDHRCVDCGDPNPLPICGCGHMRAFNEPWWIVPRGVTMRYLDGVPHPHLHAPSDLLEAIRIAIIDAS